MKTLKEKPVLTRCDMVTLFDRYKMALYDLAQIAQDKKVNIQIEIEESGRIELKTTEYCVDKTYYKTQFQSNDEIGYSEKEGKRYF